jgi:hypothetical protein
LHEKEGIPGNDRGKPYLRSIAAIPHIPLLLAHLSLVPLPQPRQRLRPPPFPPHPDSSGGLGFVGEAPRFFGRRFFSYFCAVTGVVAKQVIELLMKIVA